MERKPPNMTLIRIALILAALAAMAQIYFGSDYFKKKKLAPPVSPATSLQFPAQINVS